MMKTLSVQSCSSSGYHHIAYTDWGDEDNPEVVVCAHGLTRNARDFDALAEHLSEHFRVVCYDFPGRGKSDWLFNKQDYDYSQYLVDAAVLIARLNVESVHWLGTSMGGILGMTMASLPNNPIKNLILNDVGPFVPESALQRIASYVGDQPEFDTEQELEQFFRTNYASFGNLTDEQWAHFLKHSQRRLDNGKFTSHYDTGIAIPFMGKPIQDVDFWPVWDRIVAPTLLLRGENSDLLLPEVADQMTQRGPKAELHTIPEAGHAPSLRTEAQIALVKNWLLDR